MRAYVSRVAAAIHHDRRRPDRHRVLVAAPRGLEPRRARSTFVPISFAH
jgi:hypothetical protein